MPDFRPGADLSRAFYAEILAPALGTLPHAAGLLGAGSDALGFDTARSTDHDWGPRATVLVGADDVQEARARVNSAIPAEFGGWPTAIGRDGLPLQVNVPVMTVGSFAVEQLGIDATAGLGSVDWLLIAQQHLLQVTAGPVFHDGPGQLTALRQNLAWYPDQVWWWLLASQWMRISEEEPFVQRTAEVGDELGSGLVAARLARDCVRLALLIGRSYAPYSKWLGTAFSRLPDPEGLGGELEGALGPDREGALARAYLILARRYCALPGAGQVRAEIGPFWDRPAQVIKAERFAEDCLVRVTDPDLLGLPLVGGVDQLADSTPVQGDQTETRRLRSFYERPDGTLGRH